MVMKKNLRQSKSSSKDDKIDLTGRPPRWGYRLLRKLLSWILNPTVTGIKPDSSEPCIYALERRSLLDLIVLDVVTRSLACNPLESLDMLGESRRFFFLFRGEGTTGKVTMYRFSNRMQRIQQRLLEEESDTQLNLVPVSVYWGRMSHKQGSLARSLVSERRLLSARFRRVLGVLLTRNDVVIHFSRSIKWHSTLQPDQSLARNLRHTARLLRTAYNQSRDVALGPELWNRSALIHTLARGEEGRKYSKSELRNRRRIAQGMVSNLTYPGMRTLKSALDLFWRVTYDEIELLHVERLGQLAETHTLIYAPNHRSHIDYLVLSYLLFLNGVAIPHIAAGANMNIAVIGSLLRRCGAFFMRRHFADDADYRAIFNHYLKLLLSQGQSIEFFIEGTRSRTGWMLEPQKGLLQALLSNQASASKPLAFVPVQVSYERLVESESYQAELQGASKRSEGLRDVVSAFKLLRKNYGTIKVSLGRPILTESLGKSNSHDGNANRIASEIVFQINETATVNSSNLLAMTTFTLGVGSFSLRECYQRLDFLRGLLRVDSLNHDFKVDQRPASEVIVRTQQLRLLNKTEDSIEISEALLASLAWYRNNTLHTLAIPSLLAVVLLAQKEPITRLEAVRQTAGLLPHVCGILSMPLNLRDILRWLTHLRNASLISESDSYIVSVASEQARPDSELSGLSQLIMPMLECMYATSTCLIQHENESLTRGKLLDNSIDLIQQSMKTLDTESLLGFDRRFFDRVIQQLQRYHLVTESDDGKLCVKPALSVIQRRATAAIPTPFQAVVRDYFNPDE